VPSAPRSPPEHDGRRTSGSFSGGAAPSDTGPEDDAARSLRRLFDLATPHTYCSLERCRRR
jgi:hypothetical protein